MNLNTLVQIYKKKMIAILDIILILISIHSFYIQLPLLHGFTPFDIYKMYEDMYIKKTCSLCVS